MSIIYRTDCSVSLSSGPVCATEVVPTSLKWNKPFRSGKARAKLNMVPEKGVLSFIILNINVY